VEVRTLKLDQINGAEFDKKPGDKVDLKELNEDGELYILEMPHYCLTKMEQIRKNMTAYISRSRDQYLGMLRKGTDITWLTTRTAMEYATQFLVRPIYVSMGESFDADFYRTR
jgi:hypothetical protein